MALAFSLSNAAACSDGNHVTMTAALGALSGNVSMLRSELLNTPSAEELKDFARLYARIVVAQLSNPTALQVRNAINAVNTSI